MTGDASKVRAEHLQRHAYVYVRQSSPSQVLNHLESQRRQYAFAERAVSLGWSQQQVVVIDEDQGTSASRAHQRSGFGRIVTAVGSGQAGIVMSLEASRLARNSPDWHNLIYMSRYTDTLIADEHGVYDPSDATDRMVLGLRGQMSELELETSIRRMQEGRLNKARRGDLIVHPPAGYDIDERDRLIITHDESVREAIATVFAKFGELKSAKSVSTWFVEQGLDFPVRQVGLRGRPVVWRKPIYAMFLRTLHHPIYAGAYVFGRTRQVRELEGGSSQTLQTPQVQLQQEDWAVLLRDHHDGYISWQQYEQNQELLRDNQQMKSSEDAANRGPAREGWALLQGLVRCGRCGRPMNVGYGGKRPGGTCA